MLKEQVGGAGPARLQYTIKRTMPAAFERFHNSLDELENEVVQAQAVLRRDLALMQAERIKREQAEAAERQRLLAAESSAKKKSPVRTEAPKPVVVAPTISPPQPTPTSKPAQLEAPPADAKREKEETSQAPPIASVPAPPPLPVVEETPAAQDEFDFDAMFGDSMDDIKADEDTSNNQADVDMDAPGPDLNFTLDDSAPSLLRGLEDFAKSSDEEVSGTGQANTDLDLDFPMPDIPDVPTSQPPPAQPPAPKPTEPTTSQLTDNADMLDTMATDDLDDLFNMDYENPEETQFDDAFFGFDES
ncbi:hypothetical protein K504DRAFT_251448 [Pleomassaria siparia CBS 279.74]|uniref:Uncharacterized protein n=1 Tax=Pleomassaria siparia CBS 279.74 TaxID=1314801 RepID=A0A6G1KCE4_9PLEO|nr:hypothetical protein K504DRAFT_251448 [Pleomassaria siparia CBS 279.74]